MEPRTIAIGLIAVIAAFAAAFGISSSGGGGSAKPATAGPGTKATTIKVAAPAAVAGVKVGGTVPALRSAPKAHKKKASKKSPSTSSSAPSTSSTSSSSSSSPSTSTQQSAPSTQNSAPAP